MELRSTLNPIQRLKSLKSHMKDFSSPLHSSNFLIWMQIENFP